MLAALHILQYAPLSSHSSWWLPLSITWGHTCQGSLQWQCYDNVCLTCPCSITKIQSQHWTLCTFWLRHRQVLPTTAVLRLSCTNECIIQSEIQHQSPGLLSHSQSPEPRLAHPGWQSLVTWWEPWQWLVSVSAPPTSGHHHSPPWCGSQRAGTRSRCGY